MKNILKNSINVLILITPFVVIFVSNSLFFPFISSKGLFFRILVELIVGLYLALCVADPAYRPKKSPLSICLWIFGAIILVVDIFSPNPTKAIWSNFERMEGFISLAHLLLYFLVVSSIYKKKEDWSRFFFVSIGVSVYLIFFGLLQLSGEIVINQGGARVDGTLGNAAYFAIYLVFQLAIITLTWWRSKGNIKGIAEAVVGGSLGFVVYYLYHISNPNIDAEHYGKIYLGIAVFMSALAVWFRFAKDNDKVKTYLAHTLFFLVFVLDLILLYFTATRGAILGFLGGLGLFSLFLVFQKENKNLKKVGISVLGAMALVVIIFFSIKDTTYVQSNPVLSRFASISWSDTKDQARAYVWPMAMQGVKEKPILGWGQEGFGYIFNKHYNPLMWRHEPWFDRAHNSYLDWFVAGGLLGLLSYLSIFFAVFYFIFKARHIETFERALLLGLFGGYAFNNIFVFDNLISYLFFFTFLAMIHSEWVARKEEVHIKEKKEGREMLIFLSIALSLVTIYFVNIKAIVQNKTLIYAMSIVEIKDNKLMSCVASKYTKDEKGEYKNICLKTLPTLDLFKKAISTFPTGQVEALEQFLNASSRINTQAQVPNEIKQDFAENVFGEYQKYLKTATLDAREFLIFGSYLRSIGQLDLALEMLQKAREISPKKQQILFELGNLYINKGQGKEAYEVIKEAYEGDVRNTEAKILYALVSAAMNRNDEFEKLLWELADAGVADQRLVDTTTSIFGKNKTREYLNRVLKTDQDNKIARDLLGSLNK